MRTPKQHPNRPPKKQQRRQKIHHSTRPPQATTRRRKTGRRGFTIHGFSRTKSKNRDRNLPAEPKERQTNLNQTSPMKMDGSSFRSEKKFIG